MITRTHIRSALTEDAPRLSALIQTTIRVSNAQDYPVAVIDRVVEDFSVSTVQTFIKQRQVLVAIDAENILGTASLDSVVVRSVFVHPEWQGRGLGLRLMEAVETMARNSGIATLRVPASLTARSFYARLGYKAVREVLHGEERTILMEKALS